MSGAKAHRLTASKHLGTDGIPAVTPAAEHLSTLSTLKEVRGLWNGTEAAALISFFPPAGGLFGRAIPMALTRRGATKRKRAMKPGVRAPVKRKSTAKVISIKKKTPSRAVPRGKRQSTRLAFTRVNEEVDGERMEVSDPIRSFFLLLSSKSILDNTCCRQASQNENRSLSHRSERGRIARRQSNTKARTQVCCSQ